MGRSKLRVAFLLDSEQIPAWQFSMITSTAGSEYASTCVLTLSDPESGNRRPKHGRDGLFEAFVGYEAKRHKGSSDACARMSVADLPRNIPQVPIGSSSHGPPLDFDVVVALGGLPSIDEFSAASSFGVWYYEHSSNQTERIDGTSVAFWEVIERRPYAWSRLLARKESGDKKTK